MRPLQLSFCALLLLSANACMSSADVPTSQKRDPVYAGLVGQWQGTVEVRDTANFAKRVKHKAAVRVVPVPGSDVLEMRITTTSGADTVRRDTDWLRLDKSLTAAEWSGERGAEPQQFSVLVNPAKGDAAPLQVVLEGDLNEHDCPSTIRETMTITPGQIKIVQETRVFGGEFVFQRAFLLRRVA